MRLINPLFAGAIASLMGACAPLGTTWTETQSPKAIALETTEESYVVKLDAKAKSLPEGERQELDGYLRSLGDLTTVEFSLRRTHRGLKTEALVPVERALVAAGADPRRIFRLAEIGVDYKGQWADIEIIAKRVVAFGPQCPDMSRPEMIGRMNENSSSFGCATSTSLALQIADPADLERGRALDAQPGATAAAAIERYRTDKVKELRDLNTRKQNESK